MSFFRKISNLVDRTRKNFEFRRSGKEKFRIQSIGQGKISNSVDVAGKNFEFSRSSAQKP